MPSVRTRCSSICLYACDLCSSAYTICILAVSTNSNALTFVSLSPSCPLRRSELYKVDRSEARWPYSHFIRWNEFEWSFNPTAVIMSPRLRLWTMMIRQIAGEMPVAMPRMRIIQVWNQAIQKLTWMPMDTNRLSSCNIQMLNSSIQHAHRMFVSNFPRCSHQRI